MADREGVEHRVDSYFDTIVTMARHGALAGKTGSWSDVAARAEKASRRWRRGPGRGLRQPSTSKISGELRQSPLYGLLDERSDTSGHRSLSDLTPLLEDKRYNELLVLGGDLNALAAAPAGTMRLARDQGVLDRITEGFGLVDLLRASLREHHPDRGGLAGCQCGLGSDCQHNVDVPVRGIDHVPSSG